MKKIYEQKKKLNKTKKKFKNFIFKKKKKKKKKKKNLFINLNQFFFQIMLQNNHVQVVFLFQ